MTVIQKTTVILVFSLLLFFPIYVFADVSKFVFVTDPQSISINILSDVFTIQSQDISGTKTNIPATMYVTVTPTSATGVLYSNTSGTVLSVPVTMSKNSANKNFYYKDSIAGTYQIQVSVASEKGGATLFSSSQSIIVGSGSVATSTQTGGSQTTTTTETSVSEDANTGGYSSHSSPAPLSQIDDKMEFEISAGRDRLVMLGSMLDLRAVVTKSKNILDQSISYEWSFGDGTTERGISPKHSYRFVGDYAVVVNASYSDQQAVSRIKVRVVSPNVLLNRVDGGVEVVNNSGVEINLGGWILSAEKRTFTFPQDTIIASSKKIVFANILTGIYGGQVAIVNPLGKAFAILAGEIAVQPIVPQKGVVESNVQAINTKTKPVKVFAFSKSKPDIVKNSITVATTSPARQSAVVFEAKPKTGAVNTVLSLPMRSFNFIKHLFVEE